MTAWSLSSSDGVWPGRHARHTSIASRARRTSSRYRRPAALPGGEPSAVSTATTARAVGVVDSAKIVSSSSNSSRRATTSRSVIRNSQPQQEPLLVLVELDLIDAATQRANDRCLLFGLQLDRCRAAVIAGANRLQPLPKALLVVVPASPPLRRPKRVTGNLDLIVAQDHVRTVVVPQTARNVTRACGAADQLSLTGLLMETASSL